MTQSESSKPPSYGTTTTMEEECRTDGSHRKKTYKNGRTAKDTPPPSSLYYLPIAVHGVTSQRLSLCVVGLVAVLAPSPHGSVQLIKWPSGDECVEKLGMGRAPCCDKASVKRGPWSPEEDEKLRSYVQLHGIGGNWIALPQRAGLNRCGKSCRLRWLNYLRPDIRHGGYTEEEDHVICSLYSSIGSRWSIIASKLPGRTDNDVKNYWNTKLKKKAMAAAASVAPATPPALSPAGSASSSSVAISGGDGFFATLPQPQQGLIRFDAQPSRSPTQLQPVPPPTAGLDGAWAAAGAMDDALLSELGGGEQMFSYGDFFGGLPPQDRALELSACYFPNMMAEMWGGAAAGQSHAKPQGLCNALI